MNLYILRHASAGTRRANPLLDIKRPLDREGKQFSLQLAYVLQAMKIQFDAIVSSPLKRALQTAVLVGTENGFEAPVLLSKALAPESSIPDFHKLLQELQVHENVLVVGHSPNIESILGSLLATPGCSNLPKVRLRKGSIARLSITRGPATLMWLLDPRTVRALYSTTTKKPRRKAVKKKT